MNEYRVRVITKELAGTLRHSVFCEEFDYFEKTESMIETDLYDDYSVNIGLFYTDTLIGCIRVIRGNLGKLALETYADFTLDQREQSAEISRIAIRPEHRGGYPLSLPFLYLSSLSVCKKMQFKHAYMGLKDDIINHLRKLMSVEVVASNIQYHGERSICKIDIDNVFNNMRHSQLRMYDYVESMLKD